MLHGMAAPLLLFSSMCKTINRPGGCPHQVCPCLIILRLFHGNRRILDDGFHHSFHKAVQHIQVCLHIEIHFHDMWHHISSAAGRLISTYRIGICRVKKGYFWEQRFGNPSNLILRFRIADHASRIHFWTGSRKGRNGQHRKGFFHRRPLAKKFPGVMFHAGSCRHPFSSVQSRTAAYGKQYINVFSLTDLHPFPHWLNPRIWRNTGQFIKLQSGFFDFRNNCVI